MSHNDDTRVERPRAVAEAAAAGAQRSRDTARRPRRIAVGDRIGRYVVEKRVGSGGMGVVYLAHDPDLERPVAIKIVRPGMATGRTRLLREGQAIARLIHPNVVTVFDVGALGEDLFIAMEYVPGTTLEAWLRAAPRPWRLVLDRFLAAAEGLAAAHRVGLVHRDFKPDNILLDDGGRVVVSDFGLVRTDDSPSVEPGPVDDLELTRTAGVVGTPAYMSPEQFQHLELDARTDQFSFCVALWQGLFGVRPFDRGSESATTDFEALSQAVLTGAIHDPPRSHRIPRRIVRALRRGLAVEPADRFPSMTALAAALRPPDRRLVWLGMAAAGLAVAAVAVAATRSPPAPVAAMAVAVAAAPGCASAGDPVTALWTAEARAAYLARPGDPVRAAEDAGWFDELARRWAATATAVCDQPPAEPARAATCLADALAALSRAVARPDRSYWPEVLDPRACVRGGSTSSRELRLALGNIDPSGAIAPDGSRIAFAGSGLSALMTADGENQRGDILARVTRIYGWSPEPDQLIARVGTGVVRVDLATGDRSSLPWTGDIVAVARGGAVAARRDAEAITFLGADGGELSHFPVAGFRSVVVDLEPGGRRAAVVADREHWTLWIVEVATGRAVRHRVGLHGDAGSAMAMLWSGPGALVLGGSSRPGDDEGLWRLDIAADGAIAGPPALLIAPRPSTIMDLIAIDGARALVVMVDVPTHLVRRRGGRSAPVPGLLSGRVIATDIERRRLLLRDHGRRRAWLTTPGGKIVAEGSTDLGYPVLYDGGLWFAHVDGGDLVLVGGGAGRRSIRMPARLPAPLDRMRCPGGGTTCFVSWFPPGSREVQHAVVTGRKVKRGFEVPAHERDLDLSADGRRALAMTDHELIEYDLRRRSSRVIHREPDCELAQATWSSDGTSILFSTDCKGTTEIRTRPARAGGEVRTVTAVDGQVIGLEELGRDDLVYSTIDYESRLVVVDGLPLP